MIKPFTFKSIPVAATLAAALLIGGVAQAQGAGAPGAASSGVQTGGAPAAGTTGAEPGAEKPVVARGERKAKQKTQRMNKSTKQQPAVQEGQATDPSRVKP